MTVFKAKLEKDLQVICIAAMRIGVCVRGGGKEGGEFVRYVCLSEVNISVMSTGEREPQICSRCSQPSSKAGSDRPGSK